MTTKRVSDRMFKGDSLYRKGNGKTEQVREMGDAGWEPCYNLNSVLFELASLEGGKRLVV